VPVWVHLGAGPPRQPPPSPSDAGVRQYNGVLKWQPRRPKWPELGVTGQASGDLLTTRSAKIRTVPGRLGGSVLGRTLIDLFALLVLSASVSPARRHHLERSVHPWGPRPLQRQQNVGAGLVLI
jgi:hypothetical protein